MLFSYVYVPHSMEKMQGYIDYIFCSVWCRASKNIPFSFGLFSGNLDLKEIITAFHYSNAKGADFFNGHVEKIYTIFSTLSGNQIGRLKSWYKNNNDLEKACGNHTAISLIRYDELAQFHTDLSTELAAFFKGLYSKDLLNLAVLRKKIGTIDDHYKAFMSQNRAGKCPFCGIQDIKGIYHSKRDAYDHYLPKGVYPFNSINFKNLAPTCHECNSAYKLTRDPLLNTTNGSRKAFYPYSTHPHWIELKINLSCADWTTIKPEEIGISAGPDKIKEQISTWDDVYGIKERYQAKCCGENDGKGWIREVVDESQNYGLSPFQYLEGKLKTAKNEPWVDDNFLKAPFLKACRKAGFFDDRP